MRQICFLSVTINISISRWTTRRVQRGHHLHLAVWHADPQITSLAYAFEIVCRNQSTFGLIGVILGVNHLAQLKHFVPAGLAALTTADQIGHSLLFAAGVLAS